jgi:CHAD domain-containing protein
MKCFYHCGDQLPEICAKNLSASIGNTLDAEAVLYDSFNGHLDSQAKVLLQIPGRVLFFSNAIDYLDVPQDTQLKRIADIHDSGLRRELEELFKLRGLVPGESIHLLKKDVILRDSLEKTVLFYDLFSFTHSSYSFHFVRFRPLKGYEGVMDMLTGMLEADGWKPCVGFPVHEFKMNLLLLARGSQLLKLPAYTMDQSTSWVVLKLCSHYLDQVKANEDGVLQDIDTEFLHDLRVASRKSRSILKLFKKVLEPDLYDYGQDFLRKIGKATNAMRDYDVFLLNREHYHQLLPPVYCGAIEPFFQFLVEKRATAFADIQAFLRSREYEEGFLEWQVGMKLTMNELLAIPSSLPVNPGNPASGEQPIGCTAYVILKDIVAKIKEDGSVIHSDSPDEMLHDLRIECKKMRYLLNLFEPINAPGLKSTLRQIKGFQELLGEFNDLSVQEAFFEHYVGQLPAQFAGRDELLLTMGMLMSHFYRRKQTLRDSFFLEFPDFVRASTKMIRTLEKWKPLKALCLN